MDQLSKMGILKEANGPKKRWSVKDETLQALALAFKTIGAQCGRLLLSKELETKFEERTGFIHRGR